MSSAFERDYIRIRSLFIRFWPWIPIAAFLIWFGWMIGTPSAAELRDAELSQRAFEYSNAKFDRAIRGR